MLIREHWIVSNPVKKQVADRLAWVQSTLNTCLKELERAMAIDQSTRNIIDNLKIAKPCPVLWSNMQRTPKESTRICGECRKNVYDISKMSAREASMLLQGAELSGASNCMQLRRRADGTVIIDDCPAGLRRIRDSWTIVRSAAGTFALLLTAQCGFAQSREPASRPPTVPMNGNIDPQAKLTAPEPPICCEGARLTVDWRAEAMKIESVKKIADKIAALQKQPPLTYAEQLQVLKLRYDMAVEADARGLHFFAALELRQVQASLQSSLKDSFVTGEKATNRVKLLKEVLKARIAVHRKLDVQDMLTVKEIQDMQNELDKLN